MHAVMTPLSENAARKPPMSPTSMPASPSRRAVAGDASPAASASLPTSPRASKRHSSRTSKSNVGGGGGSRRSSSSNNSSSNSNNAAPKKHNLGLSELSKQLRILQNQNKVQQIEIDRLERQLKLLADLQNVSVADLRNAMLKACQAEAHDELQRTVSSLRAQLQAANLANQKGTSIKEASASNDIANLQLRLGELEEVEEKHKAEIKKLYSELSAEKERATRLEAKCADKDSEIDALKERGEREKLDTEDFMKKLSTYKSKLAMMETTVELQQAELEEWAALGKRLKESKSELNKLIAEQHSEADQARIKKLKEQLSAERKRANQLDLQLQVSQAETSSLKGALGEARKEADDKSRAAYVEIKICREKVNMLEKQLGAATEQHKLRSDQFKARFKMQGERIQDLEQQLTSLYTAFELLKSDRSAEEASREKLRENLATADAKVAQQVEEMEKKGQGQGSMRQHNHQHQHQLQLQDQQEQLRQYQELHRQNSYGTSTPPVSPFVAGGGGGRDGYGDGIAIPTMSSPPMPPTARSPPVATITRAPSPPPTSPSPSPSPAPSPAPISSSSPTPLPITTSNRSSSEDYGDVVMSGKLMLKSNGMLKQWKKRTATLFQSANRYQLTIFADESNKQKMFSAPIGVSRVEENPKQQFGFLLYVNPRNSSAPVVQAAAVNGRDYAKWMSGLMFALNTKSNKLALQQTKLNTSSNSQPPLTTSSRSEGQRSERQQLSPREQEQIDLETAILLSSSERT